MHDATDDDDLGNEEAVGEEDDDDFDEQEAADFLRAAEQGNLDGVQLVREKPELLEVQDELGNSALHLAALGAHLSVVRLLLDHKADVNGVNDEGNTALILSTICMSDSAAECAKMLVESNADPEIENLPSENGGGGGCRALHYACGEGNMPIVKYLVEGAKVELRAVSKDVLTPLLCAMINNRAEVAVYLIRNDPGLLEITDSNGDYPLHLCVLENLLDMMVTLLREGADPLMVNTRNETPLTVAIDVQAEPEMLQILEQAEQEAEAQRIELKAAELEAEAETVLEHGDAKSAAEKWRAAADLYDQVDAADEAQVCRDKVAALPGSATSTPKAEQGKTASGAIDDAPLPASATTFSKLKKRLMGGPASVGGDARGGLLSGKKNSAAGSLGGVHASSKASTADDDDQTWAADLQVMQAVQKLASHQELADARASKQVPSKDGGQRAEAGGSLQRGVAPATRKDVDASGKSGTWVGDVFYSDDDEEGDELDSSPHPPMPHPGSGFVPADEELSDEDLSEVVEHDSQSHVLPVQHVGGKTGPGVGDGAETPTPSQLRRGGLLRQLQGLGKPPLAQERMPASPPKSSFLPSARPPSLTKQDRLQAAEQVQQKWAQEWQGKWDAYRDVQRVQQMNLKQTLEALFKVVESQHQLLRVADEALLQTKSAATTLQALHAPHHL